MKVRVWWYQHKGRGEVTRLLLGDQPPPPGSSPVVTLLGCVDVEFGSLKEVKVLDGQINIIRVEVLQK